MLVCIDKLSKITTLTYFSLRATDNERRQWQCVSYLKRSIIPWNNWLSSQYKESCYVVAIILTDSANLNQLFKVSSPRIEEIEENKATKHSLRMGEKKRLNYQGALPEVHQQVCSAHKFLQLEHLQLHQCLSGHFQLQTGSISDLSE